MEEKREKTPFMLVGDLSKLFFDGIRAHAEGRGVSNGCRLILFHLMHGDGRTQLELSRLTNLQAPTVSVTLGKMEADGLVRRETDEKDQRQTRVYLTDAGRALDAVIRAEIRTLEETAMAGVTQEEREAFTATLHKLIGNLRADTVSAEPKESKERETPV